MIFFRTTIVASILLCAVNLSKSQPVFAGGGPENVLLVVNFDDPSSKLLANHYIKLRGIPAENVLYLSDIPRSFLINYQQYKSKILEPIVNHIRKKKLDGQIDYVVYSSGFPTTVAVPDHYNTLTKRLERENGPNAKELFKVFFAQASLTSLTYFAVPVLADEPVYMMLEANNYCRRPAKIIFEMPFAGKLKGKYEDARRAIADEKKETIDEGISSLMELVKAHPAQMALSYSLAQAYGRKGDAQQATDWLSRAIRTGWCYRQETQNDPAFQSIISEPIFAGLVQRMPDLPYEFTPTLGFSSHYNWGVNGGINGSNEEGINYLLCTMLAMTWDNGTSEKQALDYLLRSIASDGTQPITEGKFYFTDTADVRATTRKPNFAGAIGQLEAMGAKCEIVKSIMPENAVVAGAMLGTSACDWSKSKSQIMPGAIVENLTSYGAKFDGASQVHLTEFLRHGAAGSSGTVIEPFALQQKFPHPMIHVHYRRGCSLAEAFYQSLAGPFQLLIVGDALCRPWASFDKISISGVEPNAKVSGQVHLKVTIAEANHVAGLEIFLDGHLMARQAGVKDVQFDSRKMADGFHELRIVSIDAGSVQTRSNVVLPFIVDNEGQFVKLTTDKKRYNENETIRCSIRSNCGESVTLFLNSKELSRGRGDSGEFDIQAEVAGRGPLVLYAIAIDKDKKEHFSPPVDLLIDGPIRDTVESVIQAPIK